MSKQWLWCGLVAAALGLYAGRQCWLMCQHAEPSPLQVVGGPGENHPTGFTESIRAFAQEPESFDLIDLTALQTQTPEPPLAGFEPPANLPPLVQSSAKQLFESAEPMVADFKAHSADGDASGHVKIEVRVEFEPGADSLLGRLTRKLLGRPEYEQLTVMPRPLFTSFHPHESCPYDGSQFREPVRQSGHHEVKAVEKHKQPKVDTMDVRPGDLPSSVRKPF